MFSRVFTLCAWSVGKENIPVEALNVIGKVARNLIILPIVFFMMALKETRGISKH